MAKRKDANFEEELAKLAADAGRTQPDMPVKVSLLEAERLLAQAGKIKTQLAKLPGFDGAALEGLAGRIKRLGEAEQAWGTAKAEKQAASLKGARKDGEKLRSLMMAAGRYLLRKDQVAQRELDAIAEGDGVADLVADLGDLAAFAEKHAKEWAGDQKLKGTPERARAIAAALKEGVDGEKALDAQEERNRYYWLLDAAVKEVRDGARYLLRDDPKRLGPFLSQYEAVRKRRARAGKKDGAAGTGQPAVAGGG